MKSDCLTSDQKACACYVVLDRELQLVHQEVSIMLTSAINYFYRVLPVHHLCPVHGHHQRGEAAVVQHVTVRPSTQQLRHHLHLGTHDII